MIVRHPGRPVRTMALAAGFALPLALGCVALGLAISRAKLQSQGEDLAKANPGGLAIVPIVVLLLVFFGLVGRGIVRTEYAKVAALLLAGLVAMSGAQWALLARSEVSTVPGETMLITALATYPIYALVGYLLNRKTSRRSP